MRKKIVLSCNKCQSRNYSTYAKKESEERLLIKKFCKVCNAHTEHRETK